MTDFELDCINKATKFAYECLINTKVVNDEIKDYAKVYRYEHSLRVGQNAKVLAEADIKDGHNTNLFVCCMGGVLHDIGKFQNYIETDKSHGMCGALMARPFLEGLGLDEKTIGDICFSIASHSGDYHQYEYPDIREAHIVEEADDCDRYSMYRVLAKISDWEEESNSRDKIIEKCSNYIERMKRDLGRVNCLTKLGNVTLKNNIQTQIDAFNLYKIQVERTKEIA